MASTQNHKLTKKEILESLRKDNHDHAQRIFDFLSLCLTIYNEHQQKYIKSFAKHVYRWARISSHHSEYFDKTNDKKIESLMNEFTDHFNKKYLPPIEKNSLFYEIYPSKELRELVDKYENAKPEETDSETSTASTTSTSTESAENNDIMDNDKTVTKEREHQQHEQQHEHDENEPMDPSISTPSPISIISMNKKRVRPQKVLLLMDFDDTLIPSKMLKAKNYKITYNKLTYTERRELNEYSDALNKWMNTMLSIFDKNIDGNVQILTNGSSNWVTEESMWNSGKLFAQKMLPFMRSLAECNIDIISALDNWKLNCHKYEEGFHAIEPHKWKWICIKQLIRQYFGRKLRGNFDVKIISIGDSYYSEFLGAVDAYKNYIRKQKMHVLEHINVSLHRIKFVEEPTWTELRDELKWTTDNIEYIVNHHDKSTDYMLENIIRKT